MELRKLTNLKLYNAFPGWERLGFWVGKPRPPGILVDWTPGDFLKIHQGPAGLFKASPKSGPGVFKGLGCIRGKGVGWIARGCGCHSRLTRGLNFGVRHWGRWGNSAN